MGSEDVVLFNPCTLAVLFPCSVLLSLTYIAYRRTCLPHSSLIPPGATSGHGLLKSSLIRIYVLSLLAVQILLTLIQFLDPCNLRTTVSSAPILSSVLVLFGYTIASVILVLPMFRLLYGAAYGAESKTWKKAQTRWRLLCHLAIFSIVALFVTPIVFPFSTTIGTSYLAEAVARCYAWICFAVTTIPSSFLGMMIAFGPLYKIENGVHRSPSALSSYISFLNERKLDSFVLEGKSDQELSDIISLALSREELDKADDLSKILLSRHCRVEESG